MELYFGNEITTVTTVLLVGFLVYTGLLLRNRTTIRKWGRHILFLTAYGLYLCVEAATRDDYVASVVHEIEGTKNTGVIGVFSVPGIIGMIGAGIIVISGISSLFVRDQRKRRILCFIVMAALLGKIVVIEGTRILMAM